MTIASAKHIHCPVCGLACVKRLYLDCVECPTHGEILGMTYEQTKGMAPWEALVEIRCAQMRAWLYSAFEYTRRDLRRLP